MILVDEELSTRKERLDRFNALPVAMKAEDEAEDNLADDEEEAAEAAAAPDAKVKKQSKGARGTDTTYSSGETKVPTLSEIANVNPGGNGVIEGVLETTEDNKPLFKILAAADTG